MPQTRLQQEIKLGWVRSLASLLILLVWKEGRKGGRKRGKEGRLLGRPKEQRTKTYCPPSGLTPGIFLTAFWGCVLVAASTRAGSSNAVMPAGTARE